MNADRRKTLQELENENWGEPTFNSYLVSTVHRLRCKPLESFTIEDLRMMISQNLGLPYLMPLAIEQLEKNPLAEGDYYPGDLLKSVLSVESLFWITHPDLCGTVDAILNKATGIINESTRYDYRVSKEALKEGAEIFRAAKTGDE